MNLLIKILESDPSLDLLLMKRKSKRVMSLELGPCWDKALTETKWMMRRSSISKSIMKWRVKENILNRKSKTTLKERLMRLSWLRRKTQIKNECYLFISTVS